MTTRTILGSVAACLAGGLLLVAIAHRAHATDYIWIGGASGNDNSWNNDQNWHLVEFGFPGNDDTATIDGIFSVFVDAPFTGFPNALTIAGGAILYTGPTFFADGYELVFDNETGGPLAQTLITGTNSILFVTKNLAGAHLDAFDTDLLTVENGGTVWMQGSVLEVDRGKLDINSGGTVRGYGSIDLEVPLGSLGVVLENDGILHVTGGAFGSPAGGTLDIDVTSANGRIDLDGTSGNGQVVIAWQSTLDIGAPLNDPYSDLMTFAADSKLIMSHPWSADVNSTIDVSAETATVGVPDIATIAGGTFSTTGEVNVNSGTLVIETGFIATSTAIVDVAANSTLQLDGTASFSDGSQLDLNAASTTLVVNGSTNISGGTFNWDGPGSLANVTTVGAAGVLTLNVDEVDVGNNRFDGTINNSGEINVNLTDPNDTWTMAGTLNMDAATGAIMETGNMIVTGEINVDPNLPAAAGSNGPAALGVPGTAMISGDIVEFHSTSVLNVNGGVGIIMPDIRVAFQAGSTVNVAAGATVALEDTVDFEPGANVNLAPTAHLRVVSGTTTIDSIVDFNGSTVNIDENATLILHDLNNNVFNATINSSGEINVNLTDPNDTWTMAGTLNMVTETGNPGISLHAGSVNISGEVNVSGTGTAMIAGDPLEFGSTSVLNINGGIAGIMPMDCFAVFRPGSTVNVAAGAELRTEGTVDFDAGAILNLDSTSSLEIEGTTTIDTIVDFNGSTVTIDENATLILRNLSNDIFNAPLNMAAGSTLQFDTSNPLTVNQDWGLDSGAGNISILLPAQATFGGKVNVSGTGTTTIAGQQSIELLDDFNVNAGATAILSADLVSYGDGYGTFPVIRVGNGATLTLNVNQIDDRNGNNGLGTSIHIDGGLMEINITNSDPYFLRGTTNLIGSLGDANPPTLRTDHMVVTGELRGNCFCDIELLVIDGNHVVGSSAGATHVTGDYEQTASGVYEAEIGGLVPGDDYDNITVDGTAMLGGELNLALINSFAPTLGNSFEILSAAGGVLGEFDTVVFNTPGGAYLGGGLALDVIYNPTDVSVDVISVLLGDFDVDGDVDGFDFLKWQRDPSVGPLADWEANYGMVAALSATSAAVPEPTSFLLATLVGLYGLGATHRRKRK